MTKKSSEKAKPKIDHNCAEEKVAIGFWILMLIALILAGIYGAQS